MISGEIAELIEGLHARRRELTDRLSRLERDAQRANEPLVSDFADQAVQRQNDEVVDELRASARAELASIESALHRAAHGTYGRCTGCEQPIEFERLRIMPVTELCKACAASAETGRR